MLLIFLDCETTGLDPQKHRVIEIAYKIYDTEKKRVIVSYDSIVSQPAEVMAEASMESLRINGFTQEMIMSGKSERSVSAEIINDFHRAGIGEGKAVFICQNPSFDRTYFTQLISVEMQKEFRWPYHWLDLASMYWATNKDACKEERDISKDAIAEALSLPAEQSPHRAMNGVVHLMQCYSALFQLQIPELVVDERLAR
ncbi:MAG: 3'-5' exonuclease [Chlamydiales bacterium]|nr:3'-5' exonuclease [Chlamydiales bacterium]